MQKFVTVYLYTLYNKLMIQKKIYNTRALHVLLPIVLYIVVFVIKIAIT